MSNINTFDDRSVRKIANTVAYVENITQGQAAGQRQFGDNEFKVKLTSEILPAGSGQWNATEVIWDGSAFAVPSDAELWDSDTPLIVTGADGEVDDILSAEALTDTNQDTVWLAIKPEGGGDTKVRLKVKATATSASGAVFLCDIIDNAGTVLTANVNVRQNKFASAKFYINEIIYGDVSADGEYIADPYLAGIGVG